MAAPSSLALGISPFSHSLLVLAPGRTYAQAGAILGAFILSLGLSHFYPYTYMESYVDLYMD